MPLSNVKHTTHKNRLCTVWPGSANHCIVVHCSPRSEKGRGIWLIRDQGIVMRFHTNARVSATRQLRSAAYGTGSSDSVRRFLKICAWLSNYFFTAHALAFLTSSLCSFILPMCSLKVNMTVRQRMHPTTFLFATIMLLASAVLVSTSPGEHADSNQTEEDDLL